MSFTVSSPVWGVQLCDDRADEVHDPAPVVLERLVVPQVLQVELAKCSKVVQHQGLNCLSSKGALFTRVLYIMSLSI